MAAEGVTSSPQTSVPCLFLLNHHDLCHSFRFPRDDEWSVVSGGHAVRASPVRAFLGVYIYIRIGTILSMARTYSILSPAVNRSTGL